VAAAPQPHGGQRAEHRAGLEFKGELRPAIGDLIVIGKEEVH
jgi:hypothetical protein